MKTLTKNTARKFGEPTHMLYCGSVMNKHTSLNSRFSSAFSLVELLVVIAVIAIIAAIAIRYITGAR
jgi:prepilin-type N-terminal cleavage/methylation domain-containing protein